MHTNSTMSDESYIKDLFLAVVGRPPQQDELNACRYLIQNHSDFKSALQYVLSIRQRNFYADGAGQNDLAENIYNTKSDNALDPDMKNSVIKFFAPLSPMDVVGYGKIRVGRDWDGGYVMIDDFEGISAAYSLGISNDVSWDMDIANLGILVNQYDGTIENLPQHHPNFNWQGYNIGCGQNITDKTIGLKAAFESNNGDYKLDYLLKMDIEGCEWEVLADIDLPLLRTFRQIVCEMHDLSKITDIAHLKRMKRAVDNLTKFHNVVHVHANNNSHFTVIGGVPIPNVIELTLLRREDNNFTTSHSIFPTHLDAPCSPQKADLFLGSFKFVS